MSLAERSLALLAATIEALGPAGEQRAGQEQMCAATAEAFAGGRHLAVAAGTGTGKSLAYLVPAVLSGQRVVVATATKALQDQLATKELPFLAGLAATRRLRPGGRPFRWAVLKGRSNYICRQRVAEASRTGLQLELAASGESDGPHDGAGGPSATAGAEDFARLLAWADRAATGDRADVDWELPPGLWERLSVSAAQCPGRTRCPAGGACFAEAARERADRADIVVVNTHLLVLALLGTPLLPPHDLVVIDEAHQFEDTVTAVAGVSLGERGLRNAGQEVNAVVAQSGAPLANSGRRIAEILREHHGKRLPSDGPHELVEALTLASARLEAAGAALRAAQPDGDDAEAQRLRALGEVSALRESVAELLGRPEGTVAFVAGTSSAPELRLAPLEAGGLLREPLFEARTVVMTSATLGAATPAALGLEVDDYRYLDVGSPFDYRSAGLLYCAVDLPPRNSPAFPPRAIDELESLINAAKGRTLALFTSHRMLEEAAGALRSRLRWPLLRQGDYPPARLLERFATDDATCLFATIGFWQGVDVPGPALTLVTLDRLPFPRPDDPLLAARREHIGDDAFRLVDLRRAGILLAQGTGRLIRSAADRGVVAVLDPRLATARYRTALLEEVPPLRRTTDRAVVLDFLASL
ncbi:MAG: ATP-dependent DNA helicase [bacterium]|nr:ATP-dependent DNA helicase [bacterium]MXZ30395.1 ATP-dependent DNA helicase [Acidimicrobiia bacterium]MYB23794.1 ATP-dependent DNA helicase [Acidimicrobiia bacterium]MYJ13163.1 ATP-dependent DNA helicase [Acidimicrobiia bacterium]